MKKKYNFNEEQCKEVVEKFKECDTNGDGYLDKEEVKNAMKS